VLSGATNVSDQTRSKVMRVVEATGYHPNAAAQAMRTRQSHTIGVAVSRVTNPVVPEILEALGPRLTALGRRMIVWNTDAEGQDGVINAIRQRIVDGVIFTAADHQGDAIETALERDLAVVTLNRPRPDASCMQIASTNFDGSGRLARYLLASGRMRIAYVNGPLDRSTLAEREAGFRAALEGNRRPLSPELYAQAEFPADRFRSIAMQMMDLPDPPDAIACGNDLIAFAVLNGLKAAGVTVPDDVWVVGFDGVEMSGWDVFDLTTMQQPLEQMVEAAVAALMRTIEGHTGEDTLVQCPAELVIRGSTAHTPLCEEQQA
jgi:LacI family transcriptional regulator